ncbi:MAG: hypothetical protein HC842_04160 [Cytophagales bacterium]|nr:hypothetical protein [Cytophagales bacterium]
MNIIQLLSEKLTPSHHASGDEYSYFLEKNQITKVRELEKRFKEALEGDNKKMTDQAITLAECALDSTKNEVHTLHGKPNFQFKSGFSGIAGHSVDFYVKRIDGLRNIIQFHYLDGRFSSEASLYRPMLPWAW